MYSSGQPEFKHCFLTTSKVRGVNYLSVQLSQHLGRKRFSFGRENSDSYRNAIKGAYDIDLYCDRCLNEDEPIDIGYIKDLVKSIVKPHLEIIEQPKIKEVWNEYVSFHLSLNCWSESYQYTHIQRITNFINYPDFPDNIDKPSKILEWLLQGKRSVQTSKDRFEQFVSAMEWGSKNDRIDRKLGIKWRDTLSTLNGKLASEHKAKSEDDSISDEENIDPYSLAEIEMILEALELETCSRYKGRHYQYFPYVKFLWLTGCRPSEAIALKWHNVNLLKRKVKFCEVEIYASGKLCKQKGTKTQPFRYFPINQDLEQFFGSIPKRDDSEYVFTTFDGKPIIQRNLSRVWQGLLPKLGIRHRVPYQLRHSMISYHANRGFPLPQLASIVGNSEKIIREHYLKIDLSLINVPNIDS